MLKRVLLVEPDGAVLAALLDALRGRAIVDSCTTFVAARERLRLTKYDRLITNLRLGDFNGLHLVYLAEPGTVSIVYTDERSVALGQDVQDAGAFYEFRDRLQLALPAYLADNLPTRDRRSPGRVDRRVAYRGGRRLSDVPVSRV